MIYSCYSGLHFTDPGSLHAPKNLRPAFFISKLASHLETASKRLKHSRVKVLTLINVSSATDPYREGTLGINAPESQLDLSTEESQLLVNPELSFPAHLPSLDPHHHRGYVLPGVPIQSVTSFVFATPDFAFTAYRPSPMGPDRRCTREISCQLICQMYCGACVMPSSDHLNVYLIGRTAIICSPSHKSNFTLSRRRLHLN